MSHDWLAFVNHEYFSVTNFIRIRYNYVSTTRCSCDFYNCHPFLISRTLSNWVYELDKWAPSVVKIAYKVTFLKLLFYSICYQFENWLMINFSNSLGKMFLFLSLYHRELLRCAGGLCHNSAAGSSMSCWQPMNTSSRTSRYWPRWQKQRLCSICTMSWCFLIMLKYL